MANLSAFGGAQPITPGGLVELGYAEITSLTCTTSQQSVTNGPITVVCDGSPVVIEISGMATVPQGNQLNLSLYRDGSYINQYWFYRYNGYPSAVGDYPVLTRWYRDTPSAGTHTYEVKAWASNTSGTLTINANPTFQTRISKVVQQNDGLKPFWTPPLVTQLPTNPTVGDTVIYAADATNGVYWNLYYDGIGSYPWKYVGGAPLYGASTGSLVTSNNTWTLWSTSPNITIPLAGDYMAEVAASTGQQHAAVNTQYCTIGINGGGQSTHNGVWSTSSGQWDGSTGMTTSRLTFAASDNLRFYCRVDTAGQNAGFDKGRLTVTPVRVAA